MKNYLIDKSFAVLSRADSSFGSQPKFKKDGYWYKYDYVGREGIAEQLVSELLKCSTLSDFVEYEACYINDKPGCRSKDMLKKGEDLIAFARLYENCTGRKFAEDVNTLEPSERFNYIINFVKEETGIDCSRYLFDTLTLDMLIKNPDRHYRNLALIMSMDGFFRTAPIFDNGQGLYQNYTITSPDLSLEEKEEKCFSCTISGSFEQQYILAKEATGFKPFQIDYDKLYKILDTYPESMAKNHLIELLAQYQQIFTLNYN